MTYSQKKFHEILRDMIDKSGFTIYALSKQSGVNRTTIQKSLSGDRILSEEQLKTLIPFLQLTPYEMDVLWKSHQIEQIGFSTYLRCKFIKNLAENIHWVDRHNYTFSFQKNLRPDALRLPYSCEKQYPILSLIYHLIWDIAETEEPYVYLFSPFDTTFVTDLLSLCQEDAFKHIQITHLIPFVKGSLHNAEMLSYILPFIFEEPANYVANYYYEESLLSKTQVPFPYYLVTNHYVLLLSGDYETAVLLDSNMQHYYQKTFLTLFKQSSSLLQHTHSSSAWLHTGSFSEQHESYYGLNCQSYISECMDENTIKESISIFTCQELMNFGLDGTIFEQMLQMNELGNRQFLLVNEEMFHPCEGFSFYSNGTETIFMFTEDNDYKICTLHETSITFAIQDFMEHGVELHFLHNTQESNLRLLDAISKSQASII